MPDKDFITLINESTYIENINTGVTLDNSMNAKKQAQGMAYNTGQLYNDRRDPTANFYADNTKSQSNYMNPNRA